MKSTSYSKLKGQFRMAADKEIYAIVKLLNVDINKLFVECSLGPIYTKEP